METDEPSGGDAGTEAAADTDAACPDGPVADQACLCGGVLVQTGYCCGDTAQDTPCATEGCAEEISFDVCGPCSETADVQTAASCSAEDIQEAVDAAIANGDGRVCIPSGSCTLDTSVKITLPDGGSLEILGEGPENTVMNNLYAWDNTYEECLVDSDNADAWVVDTAEGNSAELEQDVHFFLRVPQEGDLIYPYAAFTYPHPNTIE